MHELLDTTTSTNIAAGGAAVQSTGLDMGRDYAILGTGITYNRGGRANFFANYDLQLNRRQTLNYGSTGVQWEY